MWTAGGRVPEAGRLGEFRYTIENMPLRARKLAVSLFLGSCAAITLAAMVLQVPGKASAQAAPQQCPAGTQLVTAANIETIRQGYADAQVGMCWNPSDPTLGKEANATKAWLQQHAAKSANISCLNPDFAEKLKALMEAVPGGPPTITDGYRGQAAQNAAKASGASQVGWCDGYHNYGLAADFNSTSAATLRWMRENAPRYGLSHLPAMSVQTGCSLKGTGFCDPAHIQIAGEKIGQCGACSNDRGNGALPDPAGSGGSQRNASSPLSNIANTIKSALGLGAAPALPAAPAAPAVASTPLPQTSQPTAAYTSDTGSAAQTPISSLISTSPIAATGTAAEPATDTKRSTSTPIEQIDAIANPVSSAIDIGSAVAIDLNEDTASSPVALSASGGPLTEGTAGAQNTALSPSYAAPQTFTSEDLAYSYAAPASSGFAPQILDVLRKIAVYASAYLQPFGGYPPGRARSAL